MFDCKNEAERKKKTLLSKHNEGLVVVKHSQSMHSVSKRRERIDKNHYTDSYECNTERNEHDDETIPVDRTIPLLSETM